MSYPRWLDRADAISEMDEDDSIFWKIEKFISGGLLYISVIVFVVLILVLCEMTYLITYHREVFCQ